MSPHSTTLAHVNWPCELDIHGRIPGFLGEPATVFQELWERRVSHTMAEVGIVIPDRVAHAAIWAINILRDSGGEWVADLADLERRLSPHDAIELSGIAPVLGAGVTLEPFISRLPGGVSSGQESPVSLQLAEWQMLLESRHVHSVAAVNDLLRAPLYRWPQLAWRSLFPPEHELRNIVPTSNPGWTNLQRARLARLRFGLRDLPRAVRTVRRSRRITNG